ncbi:MAG TPA: hypothetical protein VFT95_03370 [Micromonosporaceae bacterium]|nr:hypothetical protein [Micromonosporaceae bacterium]
MAEDLGVHRGRYERADRDRTSSEFDTERDDHVGDQFGGRHPLAETARFRAGWFPGMALGHPA